MLYNTTDPVKMNMLDAFKPHLEVSKRSDSRTIDGIHIGKGVQVIAVPRPAAGWKRDKEGNPVPSKGYLLPETFFEVRKPEELLAVREGTPTKWDGIAYQVEVHADAPQVRRLMPIMKEAHDATKSIGRNMEVPWYAVEGGFCSPLYLSFEFHSKLSTLAAELQRGTVKVTLYLYDKDNPKDCEVLQVGNPIVDVWHDKDSRSRVLSKRGKLRQAMSLLDKVDAEAEKYREKKRSLNR